MPQPLSEILCLHRRAEAAHTTSPASPPSSSTHTSHLPGEISDDDVFSSDSEPEGDPRLAPSWNLSTATHSDDAAHELNGEWHHPSLRKILPQSALFAIVVAGTFIMSLIIFGVWWGKRKKRLADVEEKAWREIEDETERAKAIAASQERGREIEEGGGGWRGRVRRSIYNVRHSMGEVLHGHHGGGGGGGGYGEHVVKPQGVHFAPEVKGRRY